MVRGTVISKLRKKLPGIGQRMLKTAVAVFICLMIYCLRGYHGQSMPTEAVITAIICMQPYIRDSREYAVNRLAGTLVGTFWGLLFLLLFLVPAVSSNLFLPIQSPVSCMQVHFQADEPSAPPSLLLISAADGSFHSFRPKNRSPVSLSCSTYK